jgi:(p)ppGpp synthase/HD superfamily hydrolase
MIGDIVVRAYQFAEKAHQGALRKFSGLPYFSHVKYVARVLEQLHQDPEVVAAGFLHDVIEDTQHSYEDILSEFGRRVADIVMGVTSDKADVEAAGRKKLYLARKMAEMPQDCLTVKLADRFHNVLFLENDCTPQAFVVKYYKETRFLLYTLEEEGRELTEVQKVLVNRITSILDFLRIRHKLMRDGEF